MGGLGRRTRRSGGGGVCLAAAPADVVCEAFARRRAPLGLRREDRGTAALG